MPGINRTTHFRCRRSTAFTQRRLWSVVLSLIASCGPLALGAETDSDASTLPAVDPPASTPILMVDSPLTEMPTRLPDVRFGALAAVYAQEVAEPAAPGKVETLPWLRQDAGEEVPTDPNGDVLESTLAERLDALEKQYADLSESHDDLEDELSGYVRTGHSASTMKLSGRIHFDMWEFPESTPGINGFESGNNAIPPQDRIGFRRLRFGVGGDVWENMEYRIEMEFANGDEVEFRDAYLGFTELPCLQTVRIGNQKRPYGLDHWNSSRYNVFLERPFIIEAFNQDARRLGIQSWSYSEDLSWNWQYGVFNQRLLQEEGKYISNNWQPQIAGRLANTIWYDECSDGRGYAHWAISGTVAFPDGFASTENYAGSGINEARFRTRPEARSESRWLDTGIIDLAKDYDLVGLENVINLGPLQLVGEYQNVWLDRRGGSQLDFHGGYVYAAYFLTGEYMPWNRETGQLDRPVPFENFFLVDTCRDGVRGGWGAWQIAARWSYGDLSDDDIQGGIGESVTLGLNWLWNPWARMQFNYIYGDIHDNALNAVGGIDYGHYQIVGTRFMIDF